MTLNEVNDNLELDEYIKFSRIFVPMEKLKNKFLQESYFIKKNESKILILWRYHGWSLSFTIQIHEVFLSFFGDLNLTPKNIFVLTLDIFYGFFLFWSSLY